MSDLTEVSGKSWGRTYIKQHADVRLEHRSERVEEPWGVNISVSVDRQRSKWISVLTSMTVDLLGVVLLEAEDDLARHHLLPLALSKVVVVCGG